jgi:hypothetical protein
MNDGMLLVLLSPALEGEHDFFIKDEDILAP